MHAAYEIFSVRGERFAQELWVGEHEIRRCDRVRYLADVKVRFVSGMRIECFGLAHEPVRPLHCQEIPLFQEIEELVVRPFRIGEALVSRIGLGDRSYLLTGHALDRMGP